MSSRDPINRRDPVSRPGHDVDDVAANISDLVDPLARFFREPGRRLFPPFGSPVVDLVVHFGHDPVYAMVARRSSPCAGRNRRVHVWPVTVSGERSVATMTIPWYGSDTVYRRSW